MIDVFSIMSVHNAVASMAAWVFFFQYCLMSWMHDSYGTSLILQINTPESSNILDYFPVGTC
jgi:hypothetical protein